jgi:DUF4097 and DUF4098 domain-containing protein YvlB
VDNKNGKVTVSTWESQEYSLELLLKAKGNTDAEASENLENIDIDFSDTLTANQQKIFLELNVPNNQWNKYVVEITVFLPESISIDMDVKTSNGDLELNDIEGESISLTTSNGRMVLQQVYANTISCRTSNGKIFGTLEASETRLTTSNGGIEINITCTFTAKYYLETSNGAIELTIPRTDNLGYEVDLDTSLGSIDINLPEITYSINQRTRKIAKTVGFETKPIKINIQADTSIGDIEIN